MLTLQQVSLVRGQTALVRNLDLTISAGECWLVLGENGCGKSTLLAHLSGWLVPAQGKVLLQNRMISHWPARERARQLAWLTQQDEHPFPISVRDQVLSGRHPWQDRFGWTSAEDQALAERCLQRLDLTHLADRDLADLSGGERRRTSLATALMQTTPLMLLDEPLSQLDVRHQQQALALLREECDAGRTLVMVSHDPNHARDLATHVLLLAGDGSWRAGAVDELLTEAHLSALYGYPLRAAEVDGETYFFPASHTA
ncbi:ABC transporter ATP-binding protein [Burkholderiaceae bacterium DAT-1]|nr:ABC transporter ATP-binding protein [Burkholderiaceae bacterium DAT-1]